MPKTSTLPPGLRAFTAHGILFEAESGNQSIADCPFCDKEQKFYVNQESGLWDCKSCSANGNPLTFIRDWWDHCDRNTPPNTYDTLCAERGLLLPETLMLWGVCKSLLFSDCWLIPAYNAEGKLHQVYRYANFPTKHSDGTTTWHKECRPTTGLHEDGRASGLFGAHLYNPKKPATIYCEGAWDGMVLWEALKCAKEVDGSLIPTANEMSSLLQAYNVVAVPSANIFQEPWASLSQNNRAILTFDSDHPPTLAGYNGMKRAANILAAAPEPPNEVYYLCWGPQGYDPELKSGYDLRDLLTQGKRTSADRVTNLAKLLGPTSNHPIRPIPQDWISGRSASTAKHGGTAIEPLPCTSYHQLLTACRKALRWTSNLDMAFSSMLAIVISTYAPGEGQVWLKVISPPSTGKTTLCSAIAMDRKHVFELSSLRGIHSGWKSDPEGREDHGLTPKIKNKTVLMKDADPLLQVRDRAGVLAEMRDFFDGSFDFYYRHGVSRKGRDIKTSWIICGTEKLRDLDSTELGARFLDCVIMEGIDRELERDINRLKARRIGEQMKNPESFKANGKPPPSITEEQRTMLRLTAGYLDHLYQRRDRIFPAIDQPDDAYERICDMAELAATLRARPNYKLPDGGGSREMSTRLTSQLVRLAFCLAAVLNKKSIGDAEVLRRVRKVALDTAKGTLDGPTLQLASVLYDAGHDGLTITRASVQTDLTEHQTGVYLRFLRKLGAVTHSQRPTKHGNTSLTIWRLSEDFRNLFTSIQDI